MHNWTKTRPMKQGYYWLHFEGYELEIVNVTATANGKLYVTKFGEDGDIDLLDKQFDRAEWAEVTTPDDIEDLKKQHGTVINMPPVNPWGPPTVQPHGNSDPEPKKWLPRMYPWHQYVPEQPSTTVPQYRDYWGGWLPPGQIPVDYTTCMTAAENSNG